MKRPVPPDQRCKGICFSLKPDLYAGLLEVVEGLGYPWTKSAYVADLVAKDIARRETEADHG